MFLRSGCNKNSTERDSFNNCMRQLLSDDWNCLAVEFSFSFVSCYFDCVLVLYYCLDF